LCGQQLLESQEGHQVLAPFAFVSVLAGAVLAARFVAVLAGVIEEKYSNYWRINPWTGRSFH
jgi:hypothetical protein